MDKWVEENIEQITLDDFPESYRDVVRAIGIKDAVMLADILGGGNYYIHKLDSMLRQFRNRLIRQEFNGSNHRKLGRKYRVSDIQIREIVDKKGGLRPA